jgi:molybdate transport system permease protein
VPRSVRRPAVFTAAGMGTLIAVFGVFFALPFVGLADFALRDSETWDQVFSDTAVKAVVLSLVTSTIALGLAVLLGTPTAYWLARSEFRGHRVLEALLDLPILLPPTVAGVALLTAFGRRGILGEPLEDGFGLTLGFTTTAVVLAQLFVAGPFYVRSARAGFASVDQDLESIAYTLGASRLKALFRVVIPLAWPSLVGGAMLTWARAMGELGATLLFAGNIEGETQTAPLAILTALESSAGLTGAVAISLLLIGVGAAVLGAIWLTASRVGHRL